MPLHIVDTHAHLDMSQFDNDREAVIKRAGEAGVKTIIAAGIDLKSSRQAIKLAEHFSGTVATIGFHPQEANLMQKDDFETMVELAKHNKVVAIGEIGLDYYRNKTPRELQLQVFRRQLELAEKTDLPVVIHSRQADSDMLTSLREWTTSAKHNREATGVIHCFSGDTGTALQYLNMGFYVSFGAYIGYPSSSLSEVIRSIPADRLLLETDSPFLPPQSHRGKRNEPAYLPMTLAVLARLRGESPEILAQQTTDNAARIFYRLP